MIANKKLMSNALIFSALALSPAVSFSAITLSSTRIIFDEKEKNTSVTLTNNTKDTYAVQIWVNGASDLQDEKVPFIASPALFRLDPGQGQMARILALPNQLPKDRESVFYFNAQEIPAVKNSDAGKNKLSFAIRTRIKMFYRPAGLTSTVDSATQQLIWQRENKNHQSWLKATNNSPYNITFFSISFGSKNISVKDLEMIPPKTVQEYLLKEETSEMSGKVIFSNINDYGGISQHTADSQR